MLCPRSHHPMLRRFRSGPSRLLVLAMSLALGACGSAESPVDPAEDPPVAATGPAATEPAATEPAATEAVAPDNASIIASSERIVFISYRDPGAPNLTNGNVYKIDPWGQHEVRVTSSFDNDYAPSWSYDNKRIAMVRYRMDGNVGHSDIYMVNADGSNGHWVRPSPSPWDLFDPTWSPDGSRLVLTVWWTNSWFLATMDVATGDIKIISPATGGYVGTRPSYNKAGTKIVYVGPKYYTVEQINADGTGHKIRYTSRSGAVDHPTFSPDGTKLAFEQGAIPGNTDIFVLVNGVTKRLTFSTAADRNATWSPDGSKIAFMSERSGTAQIWTMNAATGGSLLRITHTSTQERYPSWSH